MQLKSIYFTILIVIGGVISSASMYASDDHEMYEKGYGNKKKNKGSKYSRKEKKKIAHRILWTFLGIVFIIGIQKPRTSKKIYATKTTLKAPNTTPKATINLNGNIKARINKDVFFTKYDLSDEKLFENLGCDPKDVLILNAANPALLYEMKGSNGALSDQNNYLLKKMGEETTENKNWGKITYYRGKQSGTENKDDEKEEKKRNLDIAKEYAISIHETTGLTIAHIAGYNLNASPGCNFTEEEEKNYLLDLQKTIQQMLVDNIGKRKVILLCAIATGIFARNNNDKRLALQANLDGIENAIKEVLLKKQKLNTRIFCNGFDYDFKHKRFIGNLDRPGIEYRDGNLPEVKKTNTN